MKIGIDFGNTYSTIVYFIPRINDVEAITMAESDPASIPPMVSITKRNKMVT